VGRSGAPDVVAALARCPTSSRAPRRAGEPLRPMRWVFNIETWYKATPRQHRADGDILELIENGPDRLDLFGLLFVFRSPRPQPLGRFRKLDEFPPRLYHVPVDIARDDEVQCRAAARDRALGNNPPNRNYGGDTA